MNTTIDPAGLKMEIYRKHLEVNRLRRELFDAPAQAGDRNLAGELAAAEAELSRLEEAATARHDPAAGELLNTTLSPRTTAVPGAPGRPGQPGGPGTLGSESTGLEAKVHLRMAQAPTSIYHLLDPVENPLVSIWVQATGAKSLIRRLRVTTFIEGYSAQAVGTVELRGGEEHTFHHLPSLFPDTLAELSELTRASLNVLVEDLDSGKVEIHSTHPVWLMPRTTALLSVQDPKTGGWNDLTPYLGAFVTPNAPSVMHFLRLSAAQHPQGQLVGYQLDPSSVEPQVRAIFNALKTEACITYVNSILAFNPGQGTVVQRVRLPRESLEDRQANCIDGTVLFASLLEGISMTPGIVIVPGHAFLGWKTWSDQGSAWAFVETTMIGSHTFDEAAAYAQENAAKFMEGAKTDPSVFRLYPLDELRVEKGITPLE